MTTTQTEQLTDLQVIDLAIAGVNKERTELQAKRTTKATGRKLEALEVKEGNLEQFKKVIEDGVELVGMYVSNDVGSEVGRIFEVTDTKVEIEYLDGGVGKFELADLMYDTKSTAEFPEQDSLITVTAPGEYYNLSFKLTRLLYPGQVELEGVSGTLPATEWTVYRTYTESEVEETITPTDESDESPEEMYTGGAIAPESAPDVVFEEILADVEEGNYRFLIGKTGDDVVGQMFESKGNVQELVIQTEPNARLHWVRSVLVRKYHELVTPFLAGDKVSINPWLLAFAPENQEAYHPNNEEEDVSDILEDLEGGKGILQRIGVSDEGEIYSGYRRTLAALLANLTEVPIEVRHFDSRADFVEALFNANKQREKTPETKAREREIRHKYCSAEARAAQIANLNTTAAGEKPKALGSAWERTVSNEPDISPQTASGQSKIIQWADKQKDKELAKKVMAVFNSGDKKTKTCLDLIDYAAQSPADAKKAADMILTGKATSLGKAIAKAGLVQKEEANNKAPKGVHQAPSGTVPPKPKDVAAPQKTVVRLTLPEWIMRLVSDVIGKIDIDILASSDAVTDAALHLTGVNDDLDGLKVDWQLASREGACTIFGNLVVDNTLDWARKLSAQWMRGNISQALIFVSRPDLQTRTILKGIAAASAEMLSMIELRANGKHYSKNELTVYYLGNSWEAFYNTFEPYADVRMSRWAFDPNHKPVAFTNDELHWIGNTNGASADYKGLRLSVIKSVEGWYAEINGNKIADGLTDESMAKMIAASTADERLAIKPAA